MSTTTANLKMLAYLSKLVTNGSKWKLVYLCLSSLL
jgi:hypothetical protein